MITHKNQKYDWEALKLEFLHGPWQTSIDFRRDKGFPPDEKNDWAKRQMRGWTEEKNKLVSVVVKKVEMDSMRNTKEEEKKVRERQVDIARFLQLRGLEALQNLFPKDAEEARKLILAGMQEERIALGISEKGGSSQNLTQVNVNLPKTKFDDIIDAEDFEGLLEFVAAIKRERARRTGASVPGESQTTVGSAGA